MSVARVPGAAMLEAAPVVAIPLAALPAARVQRCRSWMVRQFGLFGGREVKPCRAGELLFRFSFLARINQRLTPFQMQATPVGRVLFRFNEFRQRPVRPVLGHQRLTPLFEWIGKVRSFLVGELDQEGVGALAASAIQRQRNCRRINARAIACGNRTCPLSFLRHPGPHSLMSRILSQMGTLLATKPSALGNAEEFQQDGSRTGCNWLVLPPTPWIKLSQQRADLRMSALVKSGRFFLSHCR